MTWTPHVTVHPYIESTIERCGAYWSRSTHFVY